MIWLCIILAISAARFGQNPNPYLLVGVIIMLTRIHSSVEKFHAMVGMDGADTRRHRNGR